VKEYSTLTKSIREMGEKLQSEGYEEIARENTGMYWIPVWNILEEMGFKLMLVNPYLIKQMPGRKSDVKDAQWIATLLHKGLLRRSLIPCKEIRELRTYSRKYIRLQQRETLVLQEMERILEIGSNRITRFVSNISGKSVLKVIKQIVHGETGADVLAESIHNRIVNKHTKEKIKASLTGFITEHHRFILEQSLEEYEMLVRQSQGCVLKMEKLITAHYQKEMELLLTLPGINRISAMIVLAETGADMKAFENSGKFSGWTGLRPRGGGSAGKFKSTATTKGNRFLRCTLQHVQKVLILKKNSVVYPCEKTGKKP
jgi:transposase